MIFLFFCFHKEIINTALNVALNSIFVIGGDDELPIDDFIIEEIPKVKNEILPRTDFATLLRSGFIDVENAIATDQ